MRILLLGATGGTGLEIVRQAVERRWAVSAVVRSPDRLGELAPYVSVVPGSVFDPQVIAGAAAGCDAVLSVIGSAGGVLGRGSTTVYSDTAATLVAALPRACVERPVLCTSAGVEARDPGEVLPYRLIAKPLFLQRAYDDLTVAEDVIRSSGLEWTPGAPGPPDQPSRRAAVPGQRPVPATWRDRDPAGGHRGSHARPGRGADVAARHPTSTT